MQAVTASHPDAAAAYRQRRTPRQMEAEVFVRANRSIREALAEQSATAIARARADNRRLWDVVLGLVRLNDSLLSCTALSHFVKRLSCCSSSQSTTCLLLCAAAAQG